MRINSFAHGVGRLDVELTAHQFLYLRGVLLEVEPSISEICGDGLGVYNRFLSTEATCMTSPQLEAVRKLLDAIYQVEVRAVHRRGIDSFHFNNFYQLLTDNPPICNYLETRIRLTHQTGTPIWGCTKVEEGVLLSQVKEDGIDPFDPEALKNYLSLLPA